MSWIGWATFAGVVFVFFLGLRSIFLYGKLIKYFNLDAFRIQVQDRFDEGSFLQVTEFCEQRLERFPNDLNAHWFLAKCAYQTKQWGIARKHFAKVCEIDPNYNDVVPAYLEEIEKAEKENG